MFDKFSLKAKLLFLCGCLLFFTLLVGGVSYWGITIVDSSYRKISSTSLPKIESIDKMYLSYQQVRINLRTLGLPGLTKEQEADSIKRTLEAIDSYEAEDTVYKKMPFLAEEKELYEKLDKDWDDFKKIGAKVLALQKTGLQADKDKMVGIFLKECPETAAIYDTSIKTLVTFHQKNAKAWVETADHDATSAKKIQCIIMGIGLLGGLGIGYFFALSISKLLNEISESLSFGSDKISNITSEISTASTSLTSSINQQASALQQTTSAVEQTSASVVSNADNAKKSTEVSVMSKLSVHSGKEAVVEVITSINEISASTLEIKNQIDQSNEDISEIVKIINEIGMKTKVINEIVFQTKLLSFNASVEAARAGEHGKGFAVVAEEVGNLARMSGASAKEISELLESSTIKVQETVENSKKKVEKLMELSRMKVEQGTRTANKCSTVLDEIISNVNNVDSLISEISHASNEQSLSIREITKAMGEIDSASHQNSSSSEQASIAAENLGTQVKDFRKLIVRLNTIVSGQKTA